MAAKLLPSASKILSFGSSTGREAATLALQYFPDATIFGVDIDDDVVAEAEQYTSSLSHDPGFIFFNGLKTSIQSFAPYDFIFANSVRKSSN